MVKGPSGVSKGLPISGAASGWTSLFGDGDPVVFRVAKYWPIFAMKDGVPTSLSDQPRNPAVAYSDHRPDEGAARAAAEKRLLRATSGDAGAEGTRDACRAAKDRGRIVYELERKGRSRRARRRCRATRFISLVEVGGRRSDGPFCPMRRFIASMKGIHRHGGADDGRVTAARDSRASCSRRTHERSVEWIPSGAYARAF